VNWVDAVALGLAGVAALVGAARGLIASALSAAGVVAGALAGARAAPYLLPDGDHSRYAPIVALAGAVAGAFVLQAVGGFAGGAVRRSLRLTPFHAVDTAGGLVFGATVGLALAWMLGAVALHLPGQTDLRQDVQRSLVLRRLNDVVPPGRLIEALGRVDPFPALAGPAAPVEPPSPGVLRRPGVRAASPSVVRVIGTACGLGVVGSGWAARRELVVTAAHVVAGQRDTEVETADGRRIRSHAVLFDARNDLALLRVPGLAARPLGLGAAPPGQAVAIVGYPEGGGLQATPGRIGRTATILSRDAYGRGPVVRTVTSLSGGLRPGNSGGPAVSARGLVETTVFASRIGSDGGFGVPTEVVQEALARARGRVSTGDCAP
jgi:S1-C subfamily serine protease